jgi:hypothetical protein
MIECLAGRKEDEIANMIMVGVENTDIYLPFHPNTYLFWVFDYENDNGLLVHWSLVHWCSVRKAQIIKFICTYAHLRICTFGQSRHLLLTFKSVIAEA